MYVFEDYTVETVFNENGEEFADVPEITFEEHTVKYLAENYYTTLDLVDLNISFSDIELIIHRVYRESKDESAVINAGFSKDGFRFEIVNKEGNVILFNIEDSDGSEYNWLDDFNSNYDNYEEFNPDNVCVIYCNEMDDNWEHSIIVNYGQLNGHGYKEYNFEGRLDYAISVVETECEEDWIARGYTFVDGIGYRLESQDNGVYKLTVNEDPENEIDLSFFKELNISEGSGNGFTVTKGDDLS